MRGSCMTAESVSNNPYIAYLDKQPDEKLPSLLQSFYKKYPGKSCPWPELRDIRAWLRKQYEEIWRLEQLPQTEIIDSHAEALEVLEHGNPIEYMLDIFRNDHIGDELLALSYIACIGASLCSNTQGLHPGTTGKSGTGKTHSMQAIIDQIPEECVFQGSFSDKAWFYSNMQPGTIFFLDDAANLQDQHIDIIKQATSNYQEGFSRITTDVQKKTTYKVNIPKRPIFFVNSVDGEYDFQFLNRQLNLTVDEKHYAQIFEDQRNKAKTGNTGFIAGKEKFVIREMWRILYQRSLVKPRIPFIEEIEWHNMENSRNYPMFRDTVFSFAAINQFQRKQDAEGCLLANHQDAKLAMQIWNKISKEQVSKLNQKEMRVMQKIIELVRDQPDRHVDRPSLLKELPWINNGDLTHVLKGRRNLKGSYVGGLVNKIPGLTIEKMSIKEEYSLRTSHIEVIYYTGSLDLLKQFESVVTWRAPSSPL